jgi:ApaG protein
VNGPGVVGQFPTLEAGQRFEYPSFCPLETSWGTMEGSYRMERDDGTAFEVLIGRFYLVGAAG